VRNPPGELDMQAIAQEELRRWQLEALFHAYTGEKLFQKKRSSVGY